MNDLNFFEGYVDKRELKSDPNLIYLLIVGILSVVLIGYIAYNTVVIKKQAAIVSKLKEEVENAERVKKVEEITEKEMVAKALKESLDKIKTLDTALEERKKIDDILLEKIRDNMPNNIFLTLISMESEGIVIEGISKDRWSVPEFQKSLEALDDYDEIFVPYIKLEEGHYEFALNMTLRGEEEDEGTNEE